MGKVYNVGEMVHLRKTKKSKFLYLWYSFKTDGNFVHISTM